MADTPGIVPRAEILLIGGSSTFSLRFPEDLADPGVRVLEPRLVFDTPYGPSPRLSLFELDGRRVLTVKMHGWRSGITRADASRQLFWVAQQAGVTRVLAEGGVGSISRLLELRDLVIPDDYIDVSVRKDVGLGGPYLLSMRDPLCPDLRRALADAAVAAALAELGARPGRLPRRVFTRGVYANTDGRHFESRAEVQMLARAGADVVGQSLCPEVYLAREIGACYAGIHMVVNYAEGVVADWRHEDLKDLFYGEAAAIGRILLDALRRIPAERACACPSFRHPTLLVDREEGDTC
ncbi:MTAP family purine nucleoside phosphorylase [Caldinitratiruptor microaerophilus]|uniref:Phosphorylase n=1 Tax=Caldinitratiruptor microaerophilus TaxID=671077 RepID=A0AA35CKD8_9FIRM|nr:MTAP family purine nucleoside phosphorylase [Caldinitratiruptor microaerophilus]BDG59127.1 phosphorylase [Caldinitratiruptor microaerophilus]